MKISFYKEEKTEISSVNYIVMLEISTESYENL